MILERNFLQQGNIYSNEATPPNSATPCELMRASRLQITTGGDRRQSLPHLSLPKQNSLLPYSLASTASYTCLQSHH